MEAKEVEVKTDKQEPQECLEDMEWREKKDPLEEMDPRDFLGYLEDQVIVTSKSKLFIIFQHNCLYKLKYLNI